jgi:hypothetical protein
MAKKLQDMAFFSHRTMLKAFELGQDLNLELVD